MAETRPSVATANGVIPATPIYEVGADGSPASSTAALIQELIDLMSQEIVASPPVATEHLGDINGVTPILINLTGAQNVELGAADADEQWSVVGWCLSISAATTLTFDAAPDLVLPIPGATIWAERPGDYAWATQAVNSALSLASTAGTVKGLIYVKKY